MRPEPSEIEPSFAPDGDLPRDIALVTFLHRNDKNLSSRHHPYIRPINRVVFHRSGVRPLLRQRRFFMVAGHNVRNGAPQLADECNADILKALTEALIVTAGHLTHHTGNKPDHGIQHGQRRHFAARYNRPATLRLARGPQ